MSPASKAIWRLFPGNSKLLAWFALKIIGILPLARKRRSPDEDPLATCTDLNPQSAELAGLVP